MMRKGSFFRELPILVALAIIVSLFIKSFLVQFFFIPSGSMENTLQINDRVAVNRIPFLHDNIERGDVIVFRDPAGWLADPDESSGNRVIGAIKDGLVLVGIVPNPAKQYLVKRVIGVAGDQVIAKDKVLTINGEKTQEPYIFAGNTPSDTDFNVTVPAGKVWVMGDHRGASGDSRVHQDDINNGMVPVEKITGQAFAVIWPLNRLGVISSHDPLAKK
jgi:signal peptidase I